MKQKQRKVEKINETQRWFFDKSNKVDKLLARLNKKEKTQITSIRHEEGSIRMYLTLTTIKIIQQYHKQPYTQNGATQMKWKKFLNNANYKI